MGRRDRKKAQTRKALGDSALRLFLERGFDQVTVTEIADAADVSVTTLFKHFPGGKPALVFDLDTEREAALVGAVRERRPGQSVLDALREHLLASPTVDPARQAEFRRFTELVHSAPALEEYGRRMWTRHAEALGRAIAEEGEGDLAARALARFVTDVVILADEHPDRAEATSALLDLLEHGWGDYGRKDVAP